MDRFKEPDSPVWLAAMLAAAVLMLLYGLPRLKQWLPRPRTAYVLFSDPRFANLRGELLVGDSAVPIRADRFGNVTFPVGQRFLLASSRDSSLVVSFRSDTLYSFAVSAYQVTSNPRSEPDSFRLVLAELWPSLDARVDTGRLDVYVNGRAIGSTPLVRMVRPNSRHAIQWRDTGVVCEAVDSFPPAVTRCLECVRGTRTARMCRQGADSTARRH